MKLHWHCLCNGTIGPFVKTGDQKWLPTEPTALPVLILGMLVLTLNGCGKTTLDIKTARARNVVLAEYTSQEAVSFLEEYELVNCWVEEHAKTSKFYLQINLKGPHVDTEPRIHVDGPKVPSYKYTASDDDGMIRVCYRINSIPRQITLSRGESVIELQKRFSLNSNHAP